MLERVGQVAYRLDLSVTSRMHPVFHVSQLKQCVSATTQVSPILPSTDALFQFPERVLQRRLRQRGSRTVAQVLVQWSDGPEEHATWEDLEQLQQRSPAAPAWGQAGIQGVGIVSDPAPPVQDPEAKSDDQASGLARGRPKRAKRVPAWLADDSWTT